MSRRLLPFFFLATLLVPAAWGQVENHPGYADLGLFERALGENVTTQLTFDKENIAALAESFRDEHPELGDLIDGVELVRVKAFDLAEGQAELVRDGFEGSVKDLKSDGWDTLVSVKDGGERVEVFMKSGNDRVYGLAALFMEDDEAGFANLVGEIDPVAVMTQMQHLGALGQVVNEVRQGATGAEGE